GAFGVHRPQAHLAFVEARQQKALAVGRPLQVLLEIAVLGQADDFGGGGIGTGEGLIRRPVRQEDEEEESASGVRKLRTVHELPSQGNHNTSSIPFPLTATPSVCACSLPMPTAWWTVAATSAGVSGRSCGCSPLASLEPMTRPPFTPPPATRAL